MTNRLHVNRQHLIEQLRQMLRIRRFEEKCAELYALEKIRGFLHLYIGEEAIAVGVMSALSPEDQIIATYREHGHALARGMSMGSILAEMYGRANGCSRGRGGSMHLFDKQCHFFGGNAIVGGGLPLATGLAMANKKMQRDSIAVCFFGEGAVAEGEFHESLNLAALWQLPVLFICENNRYAMGTALTFSESETNIARKAQSYGINAVQVDGMNVVDTEAATINALDYIRQGKGPYFIECQTYRFRGHSSFDTQLYRDNAEIALWEQKGPVKKLIEWLQKNNHFQDSELIAIEAEIAQEIEAAIRFAEAGELEPVEGLTQFVYSNTSHTSAPVINTQQRSELTYREALRNGLSDALNSDPRIFLMGEDVGRYGGCYAVSKGLFDAFGPDRVIDTPLCESGFVGVGIGAALGGMKPIVEVMTVNFSLLAMDQIINSAATLLHMSGGQFNVPLVIRMACGAGKQLAAQHSHSWENFYAHVPGLKVLSPATHNDARHMLGLALSDPDPVIIFEHVMLLNESGTISEQPDGPMDKALVRREGSDITLITYGGSLLKVLQAADILSKEGIDAEVIDLRSLRPIDSQTIVASISKTHRAVIIDEAWYTGSLAGEISAIIMEQAFWYLDAPVGRVCTQEVPIPYPQHLEQAALPQPQQIVVAAKTALAAPQWEDTTGKHHDEQ
ncbi:pyruvate dehydrogenase (acetyl-transferring) E1 component subunit alpha [Photobacterium lutimaris]|uniref:Pyruvate dehydrogenase E1 component subunit alpha n=1 Tax=Photobacterium lutimaris TaxID=388278 RepID=A0A2T3IZE7_9GAMM|nr:pyruvate dehydrogenase (acetyl-transferring) E1 component subunit alpha [Photobacterium lutimaris]PSU34024.1 pyruvate dehydrogenase (acetyl-transferring) E1 component subunit alpha [Photobacterium lutimaris]TDR76365.1 pyruvate dehydrogenase E1 component beta subunit/2-oxoisovalerate dehydrogenase E1 component [Photobacterium lutimaris]